MKPSAHRGTGGGRLLGAVAAALLFAAGAGTAVRASEGTVAAPSSAAAPASPGASPVDHALGGAEGRFRAAGEAYEAGRYAEASSLYEALLAEGYDDARVHYNLGNSRFKEGKLGPAILAYERALEREPSDADTRENLAYADLLIADKVGAPEDEFPARFVKSLAQRFDPERATFAFALFVFLAGILAAPLWLRPPPVARRALGAAAGIAGMLALLSGAVAAIEVALPHTDQAIVMAPSADGRSAPASDGTVLFTVHEGLKVQIRGERPGWIQIGVPNGLAGWIESSQVERI